MVIFDPPQNQIGYNWNMPLILTYPRSGSHYLNSLLLSHYGVKFDKSHEIQDADYIITIARNPFDSMHSNLTMMRHYGENIEFSKEFEQQYIETYKGLYDTANYVIDYDDLVNSPELTVTQLCKTLVISPDPAKYLPVEDMPHYGHLAFAKTSPEYNNVYFTKDDLIEAYEVYNKLLTKAVTIDKPKYQQLELWTE